MKTCREMIRLSECANVAFLNHDKALLANQVSGHYGTGNVQLCLKTISDFEKATQFIRQAYEEN